jgi:hypothetical protein
MIRNARDAEVLWILRVFNSMVLPNFRPEKPEAP